MRSCQRRASGSDQWRWRSWRRGRPRWVGGPSQRATRWPHRWRRPGPCWPRLESDWSGCLGSHRRLLLGLLLGSHRSNKAIHWVPHWKKMMIYSQFLQRSTAWSDGCLYWGPTWPFRGPWHGPLKEWHPSGEIAMSLPIWVSSGIACRPLLYFHL